jgi:hypothetical protein
VEDGSGRRIARRIDHYWTDESVWIDQWTFDAAPPEVQASTRPFRIPYFQRTLAGWLNLLVDAGFALERVQEPRPSEEQVRQDPRLGQALIVPWFIHLRWRKLPRP